MAPELKISAEGAEVAEMEAAYTAGEDVRPTNGREAAGP